MEYVRMSGFLNGFNGMTMDMKNLKDWYVYVDAKKLSNFSVEQLKQHLGQMFAVVNDFFKTMCKDDGK